MIVTEIVILFDRNHANTLIGVQSYLYLVGLLGYNGTAAMIASHKLKNL